MPRQFLRAISKPCLGYHYLSELLGRYFQTNSLNGVVRNDLFVQACQFGDVKLAEIAVANHARIASGDQTAIWIFRRAIAQKKRSIVRLMIDDGAELEAVDRLSWNNLAFIAHSRMYVIGRQIKSDMAMTLVVNGVEVNKRKPRCQTALLHVVANINPYLVRTLIKLGASLYSASMSMFRPETTISAHLCTMSLLPAILKVSFAFSSIMEPM